MLRWKNMRWMGDIWYWIACYAIQKMHLNFMRERVGRVAKYVMNLTLPIYLCCWRNNWSIYICSNE